MHATRQNFLTSFMAKNIQIKNKNLCHNIRRLISQKYCQVIF